jgi:hypothetical protein
MDIRLKIKMRCARRQNDAAYQRYRRRSVTGRHAILIHRRHMEYQRSRGMFLRFGVAGQPLSHGPIVLRSPVNGGEAHGGRVLWATGCDAHAGTRRVPTVASTSSHAFSSQIWPFRLQIWTEGVLVEHRAPVVRRCNFPLFRSKTDWTLLRHTAKKAIVRRVLR